MRSQAYNDTDARAVRSPADGAQSHATRVAQLPAPGRSRLTGVPPPGPRYAHEALVRAGVIRLRALGRPAMARVPRCWEEMRSSGPWRSARARLAGPISARAAVDTASRRCRVARGGSCPFRVRTLSGPAVAREVHEAATDRYPGQEGREPPPVLGLLDHSEHLRGHRPIDERGRPGPADDVAVAAGVLPGLALGELLADEPGGLGGWLGRSPGSAVTCAVRAARRDRAAMPSVALAWPQLSDWGSARRQGWRCPDGCSARLRRRPVRRLVCLRRRNGGVALRLAAATVARAGMGR